MAYSRCVALFLVGTTFCSSALAERGGATALELGYRSDNLSWNIAGNGSGQNPNILSELSWSDLITPYARLSVEGHDKELHLFGAVSHGRTNSGDNQDSDYISDNRQGEYSRSNNQADGHLTDVVAGMGYRFRVENNDGRNGYMMPMVGYALHRQDLRMTDGYQTVSTPGVTQPVGPIAGLDSRYDANWYSGWLGARFMEEKLGSGLRLNFDVAYHWVRYRAEADWNLRSDFKHPMSFEHRANGIGLTFSFNATAPLDKKVDWVMGVGYGNWRAAKGVDTVYWADYLGGGISQTRLNEVKWESLAVNIGLAQRF